MGAHIEEHRRYYLEEVTLEERAAHQHVEADLRREHERLDPQQRLANREAAVLEREQSGRECVRLLIVFSE